MCKEIDERPRTGKQASKKAICKRETLNPSSTLSSLAL